MNTKPILNHLSFVGLTALILTSSLLLNGCGQADASNQSAQQEEQLVRIPVATEEVRRGTITSSFKTTATLEARDETDVISKANGIVEEIYVEEGQYVEQGELLAKLRDDEYRIQLAQAQAELNSIQQELRRVKDMADRDMISADAYDKLRYQADLQQARFDMAKLNLTETQIRAPIAGVIAARYAKSGNMISQYQAQKLFHIIALDQLEGNVYLPERELPYVAVGQAAQLRLSAFPEQPITATVVRISPMIDTQSGTFKVVLSVANPERKLKSGMFAQVNLDYATHDNAITVPRYAVQSLDGQHSVFTVDAEGVAHKVDVTLGFEDETHVEIVSGINAGEQLVVSGQANLKDAALVQVIKSEQQS
ncbi:Multidrug resistance protein MdtA [Pseudidiomarina piscicola]|uniref:Multidrug resistance protein MdtA n=1 Tax=Pseudidiomarina piscicola TaxID=2614830 RepID=A0A6S6WM29_9GAMM|nr:efflux RND transporter periplasmic adaptor subunit [Pseudidiomarina piscicola]CAB0150250.1 Multidrug resistance protein MdtA [Pseudidiomarina piscicola]VZT39679.1 Multidrug resistance protein MdtA [Pseudomonas aeruginosa]